MNRFFLGIGLLGCTMAPALALEPIEGVYARSKEHCAAAKADFQAFVETGEVILTQRGIEGLEYNCEFLDWKFSSRAPGAVVTALCQEPGRAVPEILAIIQSNDTELELTTIDTGRADEETSNAGTYYLCEGVTRP